MLLRRAKEHKDIQINVSCFSSAGGKTLTCQTFKSHGGHLLSADLLENLGEYST